MFLKEYQIRVVNELKSFIQVASEKKKTFDTASAGLPEEIRDTLNYVDQTFKTSSLAYNDVSKNGLGNFYPRVVMKVPTGGGKTILAVEAIREYQNLFAERKTGLIVWIVPKEMIYKQTVDALRDKSHPYRQLLDQASGGKTIIKEKGQKLNRQEIEENLVVLFVMIQSISRANNSEALKVFRDSGGYDSFFPTDNRYDEHAKWLESTPNLDTMWTNGDQAQLITSLGNAIRVCNPLIIIDEIHRVFTPQAKKTIDNLNPSMVLGLSATPKEGMNIISKVSGLELKDEEMVKLDMHMFPPPNSTDDDWKGMLKSIIEKRQSLEDEAVVFQGNTGQYIRPIALLQSERTGKDQRGKGFVHSEDVREVLVEQGISPGQIAVKSSTTNELENIDLLSKDCEIRYIITKDALSEGWDCPFAYILGVIPNVNSNTGVTQLIGRILRQPRGKKTGNKLLDESYVYYSKGETSGLLTRVIAGFKEEGLEELTTGIQVTSQANVNPKIDVEIKDELKDQQYSFYLPVWLTVNGETKRRFSYDFDIRPQINFNDFELSDEVIQNITDSLSEENRELKSFTVTLSEEGKTEFEERELKRKRLNFISKNYMSRRFNETVDNPFMSRKLSNDFSNKLIDKVGEETLALHFSFITSHLSKLLSKHRTELEEQIFEKMLSEERIELAVSDSESIGFKIPTRDKITVTDLPNTYTDNLYTNVEVSSMNSLERSVATILEDQDKLLWWFRNRVGKGWYSIQGWRKNKIKPDFVAAKKKDDDEVEVIYILESKGEHLLGNDDTNYKRKVLDKMTELKNKDQIKVYQTEMSFGDINKSLEAHLIRGDDEEKQIRTLYK